MASRARIFTLSTFLLTTLLPTLSWSATVPASLTSIPSRSEVIAAVKISSEVFRKPQTSIPALSNVWQSPASIDPLVNGLDRTGCSVNTKSSVVAEDFKTRCAYGDVNATTTILLIGDSNAAMWIPALDTFGFINHVKVIALTHGGCSPWSRPWMPQGAVFTADFTDGMCSSWRNSAFAKGLSINPQLVIPVGIDLMNPYMAPPTPLESSIAKMVDKIGASRVLFIEPTPKFPSPTFLAGCITSRSNTLNVCEVQSAWLAINPVTSALNKVSAAKKIAILPTKAYFCGTKYCPIFIGLRGTQFLVYSDGFHVSQMYSQQLGKSLEISKYLR